VLQKIGRGLLAKEIAAGFHADPPPCPQSASAPFSIALNRRESSVHRIVGALVLADSRSDLYADCVGIDVEPVDDHHAASARFAF
jgi:hypothetical protein